MGFTKFIGVNPRLFVCFLNYRGHMPALRIWPCPVRVLVSLSLCGSHPLGDQTRFKSGSSPALTTGNRINSSWLAFLTPLLVLHLLFRSKKSLSGAHARAPGPQFSKETGNRFPGLSETPPAARQRSPGDLPLPNLCLHFTPASLKFSFGLLESIKKKEK